MPGSGLGGLAAAIIAPDRDVADYTLIVSGIRDRLGRVLDYWYDGRDAYGQHLSRSGTGIEGPQAFNLATARSPPTPSADVE